MKKITLQFVLSLLILTTINAQIPNFAWAGQLSGGGNEVSFSGTTDALGNVYTIGTFNGLADFDPGSGTFNMSPSDVEDAFISKLDASGNFVWAKQITGAGLVHPYSISVDAFNNVYITGDFNNTNDFDPGAGTFNMTSFGATDIFIVKLNSSGNFLWAKQLGGTGSDFGNSIYVNPTGEVYSAGFFRNVADFDPGTGTYTIAASGTSDAYVSKLDPSGNFIFAKSVGGPGATTEGNSLTVDAGGNIVFAGGFSGIVDMDPGTAVNNFTSTSASMDAFIVKLNGSGNFTWAKQLGGNGFDWAMSVAVGSFNECYVTGYFNNTVDFDPGAGTYNLTSAGNSDIFIIRLDVLGNFNWARRIGDTGTDEGNSIAYNSTGIYITGSFNNTVDFDPGASTYTISSNGNADAFVSKLDVAGNFLFARGIGGTLYDVGAGISADPVNNIYITGSIMSSSVDFDPTANTFTLSSAGGYDAFVTKWGQCIKPNAPTITTAASNLNVCVSGSVIINASPNGTITWYTSATGTTVVGTGNSLTTPVITITTTYYAEALTCAPSASRTPVTVVVSALPSLSISVTNSIICNGGYTKLIASGATSYSWSGGISNGFNFSPTVTTTYTVIGTSALGCTNTAVSTITVLPKPIITIVSTSSLLCEGETATITASGLTSYGWDTGDLTPSIVVSPTTTTSYSVSGTDANNCYNVGVYTQSVSPCIGIKEVYKNHFAIGVYPNPSNGIFTITSDEKMNLKIINSLGQIVRSISLNNENHHNVQVTDLPNGVYHIYAVTDNVYSSVKTIVISH